MLEAILLSANKWILSRLKIISTNYSFTNFMFMYKQDLHEIISKGFMPWNATNQQIILATSMLIQVDTCSMGNFESSVQPCLYPNADPEFCKTDGFHNVWSDAKLSVLRGFLFIVWNSRFLFWFDDIRVSCFFFLLFHTKPRGSWCAVLLINELR